MLILCFKRHHGSYLYDLPGSSDRIAQQGLLVPSVVPEISSSGSRAPGTFGGKGAFVNGVMVHYFFNSQCVLSM